MWMHLDNMNKKKSLLAFIAFCFLSPGFSQAKCPVKKIYSYKQASIPGIQPGEIENGSKERKETFNYWFYITLSESKSISIDHIWINGAKFSAKAEVIETSPVIKIIYTSGMDNNSIELVPKTKNKVILIYPSGLNRDTELLSKKMMKKISKNELVINFTYKGKNRSIRKKMIRVLNPEELP